MPLWHVLDSLNEIVDSKGSEHSAGATVLIKGASSDFLPAEWFLVVAHHEWYRQ